MSTLTKQEAEIASRPIVLGDVVKQLSAHAVEQSGNAQERLLGLEHIDALEQTPLSDALNPTKVEAYRSVTPGLVHDLSAEAKRCNDAAEAIAKVIEKFESK